MRVCEVVGCDRGHLARGLCGAHYARRARTGASGGAEVRSSRRSARACDVPGCGRRHKARGMCDMHMQRVAARGSVEKPEHYRWTGDDASYNAMHFRLLAERGRAADQACVDCGERAADWSYDWNAEDERRDSRGRTFSTELRCYSARCRGCHRALDAAHTRRRGCARQGCLNAHKARGLCGKHYQQSRAGVGS